MKRLELESEVSEMKRSLDDRGDELRAAEAQVEKGISLVIFFLTLLIYSPILLLQSFVRETVAEGCDSQSQRVSSKVHCFKERMQRGS